MDDGSKTFYNQTLLHTDSFTLQDVELLQKALLDHFRLQTRLIEKRKGQWVIAIPVKQFKSLYSIVLPHMHPSMMYKVHQPNKSTDN